jgi:hypothetical protein
MPANGTVTHGVNGRLVGSGSGRAQSTVWFLLSSQSGSHEHAPQQVPPSRSIVGRAAQARLLPTHGAILH